MSGVRKSPNITKVLTLDPARPRALDSSVPRDLEAICLKAMAKDPRDRYESAKALADDVQAHLEGLPATKKKE